MTTRIHIINLAVVDIGQTPVANIVDPPGDTYALQFDHHIGALVSSYPWTFQTTLQQLSRLSAVPETHWLYAFQLPAEMEGALRAVYPDSQCLQPTQAFEIRGRTLYSNWPELWARFTNPLDPTNWPPYFVALAVLVLKAQFALSIREDRTLARDFTEQIYGPPSMMGEGGMLATAKAIDASGKPSDVLRIGSNPLTAVRFT